MCPALRGSQRGHACTACVARSGASAVSHRCRRALRSAAGLPARPVSRQAGRYQAMRRRARTVRRRRRVQGFRPCLRSHGAAAHKPLRLSGSSARTRCGRGRPRRLPPRWVWRSARRHPRTCAWRGACTCARSPGKRWRRARRGGRMNKGVGAGDVSWTSFIANSQIFGMMSFLLLDQSATCPSKDT